MQHLQFHPLLLGRMEIHDSQFASGVYHYLPHNTDDSSGKQSHYEPEAPSVQAPPPFPSSLLHLHRSLNLESHDNGQYLPGKFQGYFLPAIGFQMLLLGSIPATDRLPAGYPQTGGTVQSGSLSKAASQREAGSLRHWPARAR